MKKIELLNAIVAGKITEGTQIKDDIGNIFIFKNGRFTEKYIVDDEVLNDEIEIIEEKQQQGRWEPKEGENYWYTDDCGEVYCYIYDTDCVSKFHYLTKNVFKTEKEAQEYLEYKIALLEAEKPFIKDKKNWFMKFVGKQIVLSWTDIALYQGMIYLGQDEDVAQAFVDQWYKQIMKYEFDKGE